MQKIIDVFLKYYKKYKEIINYLIFGVLTTVVNYISYVVCAKLFRIDLVISTGIAWFLSVLFAYITNRIYVFESKTNTKLEVLKEMISFFWFRILSGVFDIVIMYISVNIMNFSDLIMKLVSNALVIALNYIFSKMFIFKDKSSIDKSVEARSALDTKDAPVNILRYIVQLFMMIVSVYITYWNFSIVNILFVLLLMIVVEIILECIENYKYSKREKKDNAIKNIFKFLYNNFHYVILIFAFAIRFTIYLKLKIIPRTDFAAVFNAAKDLVDGKNILNSSSYFIRWGYQTGMVIYDTVILGILGNEIWLHIFDCLYGSIVCLFVYLISKELFSKQSAVIVSLLYTVGIYVSAFCGVLSNQHIFSIFILIGIYILVSNKYESTNYILKYTIIGTLFGIANIFRSESIIYILAVVAYVIINSLSKDKIKKGFLVILSVLAIYFIINTSASFIIRVTGINKSGLSNKDPLWKFVCGTDYRAGGSYSQEGLKYLGDKEKEIEFIKDNLKSMSLKDKINLFEIKEKEFWANIPYYWTFNELEDKDINLFNNTYRFRNVLNYIKIYDLTLVLFCTVNMTIFVLYSKIKNLEDKRIYLLYLIVLANFFVYSMIEVNGRYSYLAKVMIYILSAGGIEIVRRNAEKEAKELNSKNN